MFQKVRRIGSFLLLFMLFPLLSSAEEPEGGDGRHTLLIYMLACDLEKDSGAATRDLIEIQQSAASADGLDIFVAIGGTDRNWLPLSGKVEEDAAYIEIALKDGKFISLRSFHERACAQKDALLDFLLRYGKNGADLILWGHGCSGLNGIGYDRLHHDDTLTLQECADAIRDSGFSFRLVGLDACEMATLEVAWILGSDTLLFAASPEVEALSGWNYRDLLPVFAQNSVRMLAEGLSANGIREAGRGASRLTVLRPEELFAFAPDLCQCFDMAASSANLKSLNELLASEKDSQGAMRLEEWLNGQILLFARNIWHVQKTELEAALPGIGESYVSFRYRE